MAWRVPATPSRGSHTHPHSARQLRRRTLHTPLLPYTNYPYTQALSVLTLTPAGHSWPPSSTWYHRAGSPPPWTGTVDRDLCSHAGMPLRASDFEILVVFSGSGSQEPAAMRLCALLVHLHLV